MQELKGSQKKYLRGLAHSLNPVVTIGRGWLSRQVIRSIDEALETHELIKIKFKEFKEKEQKKAICRQIESRTGCRQAGPNRDPGKVKIELP